MKKLLSLLFSVGVMLSLLSPTAVLADSIQDRVIRESISLGCNTLIKVKNSDEYIAVPLNNVTNIEQMEDNLYTATNITTSVLQHQSKEVDDGVCLSQITVYFRLSSDKEQIKMERVTGSWDYHSTAQGVTLVLYDSFVGMCSGDPFRDYNETWEPTDSTFDYTTGWDYADYYPPNVAIPYGTRASATTEYSISNMADLRVVIKNELGIEIAY